MAYPTVPGRKFAYDVGGGSVYRGTSIIDMASALSTDEMSKLNGLSNSTYAVLQSYASNYGIKLVLWVFFPHKFNVSGLGMLHAQSYAGQMPPAVSLQSITVHGSANTTNGLDGTWIAANLPNGSIPTKMMGDDDWRDQIQPCTFSESIRCLRVEYATTGSYMGAVVYALHVYGMKAAGEVVNDILFMDDDASGDPEFIRDLDFGDRPEGTTTTHRIKLYNSSASKTANNITLSLIDQDFLFSMDEGVTWVTGATITSLAPGTASSSIIVKNTIPPPTQMLGPRSPRIEVLISANVRLGLQFRYQQGKVQVNHNWFLGYTKDEDGHLIIDPEQAVVVKRIYREYLSGQSFIRIKRSLEADGVLNGAGRGKWHETNIKQILTNEKYIGDALLQKTYTVDILEKKREANKGQVPKYYVENSHEGIIPKDIFLKVQEEITRRANLTKGTTQHKRVYSGRYALSGMVFCSHCGDIFRRIKWNNRGCKSTVWRCASRVEKDGPDCPARTVREEHLHEVVVKAINEAFREKEDILPLLRENIESSLTEDVTDQIAAIDEQIKKLQHELLATADIKNPGDDIGMEIRRLRNEKQALQAEGASDRDLKTRIDEMMTFLDGLSCELTGYDEQYARALIEKTTVYDDYFIVEFKSGIEIQIDE